MTTDAQIVKRALGALFIAVLVSWVLGIAVYSMTSAALNKHGNAARLCSFVMTADAFSALLSLMSKLTIRIQVCFVMFVTEQDDSAPSFQVEFDNALRGIV